MKRKETNSKEQEQINQFVLRHMRDFIGNNPDGIPQEVKDLVREKLREVATHKKAERLAYDICEDFELLLRRHPELFQAKKTAKKADNVEVFYTTDKVHCPNIIAADLSDGATLIENKYGFFDIYCVKEQVLKNKTPEQIRYALIGTGRGIRFLKPGEKLIVAPSKGDIGTLIEQEPDGDKIVLTFQLIIIPQLDLTKDEEKRKQESLTISQEAEEIEL